MNTSNKSPRKSFIFGIAIGVILFGAAAAGMKYSDTRPFCATYCHNMQLSGIAQKKSPHADLTCNECHAPANLLKKIPFKAQEGLRDLLANIEGKDVPIRATVNTRNVINNNCLECHSVTTNDVMMTKEYCVDCHQGIAHPKKTPIAMKGEVADE